jgi:LPXTG-motif cell wall-anchored protein
MTPEINAISTILLGISILFILISFWIAQRRKA